MSADEGNTRANELNSTFILNRFSFEKGRIRADYGFTYDGGFISEQFIKLTRKFAAFFKEALLPGKSQINEDRSIPQLR